MTSPRWYRANLWAALAPYAVGAVTVALVALGAWVALQQYGARRYEAGRASLMQESHDWLKASNGQWRRVADSLTVETRHRDTVLVTRIVRARATARRVSEIAQSEQVGRDVHTASPTIQDSLTVRAAVQDSARSLYDTPLRACGVQLDSLATECDRFRVAATAALAAKDSAAARDSVRLRAAALDAASYKQQMLDTWKARDDDAVKRRATRWLYVLAGAALTWGVVR